MADWSGRRLHFIAIGGAGMSGLALIANELGAAVSGSDRAESLYTERLRAAGLDPRIGHDAEAVPDGAEIVVSTAIPDDNPELVRARERGQTVLHRAELLSEICAMRRVIAVSGTHGKTTTAGMIAWMLRGLGADPSWVIGGDLPAAEPGGEPANARFGDGEWLVVEADESDGSFLRIAAEVAVVTNVELDHHSHWRSRTELLDAFARFVAPARAAVVRADPLLDEIAAGKAIRYSLKDAVRPELATPGPHNAENALGALAAVDAADPALGDGPRRAAVLAGFPGMARRLERKGTTPAGAVVYDDYAHHPTEVAATLSAMRELEPRRLVAVFQPHLYSRTKALAPRFGAALAAADVIGVLDVYAAREQPVGDLEGVSGLLVAEAAAEHSPGRRVMWLGGIGAAAGVLAPLLRGDDLLVTMGAGDIFELAEELVTG